VQKNKVVLQKKEVVNCIEGSINECNKEVFIFIYSLFNDAVRSSLYIYIYIYIYIFMNNGMSSDDEFQRV
jgi:hypothetical protein